MGDSILRKTDRTLSKGEDVVVCLPGARIEHVTERVENVLGHGQGGSILVHVGKNNADREGTTRIVQRCREFGRHTEEDKSWTDYYLKGKGSNMCKLQEDGN